MSELRRDPLSGRWMVLAAERARRPEAFARPPRAPGPAGDCPFCPGNERHTTPEVLRYAASDGSWAVRVVPNMYADMAAPTPGAAEGGAGLYRHRPSAGAAEVLIESPDHGATFDRHPPAQAALVVAAAQERVRALQAIPGIAAVMPFRNFRAESGASLAHPHGQILGSAHLPPVLEAEAAAFAAGPACPACELVEAEEGSARTVVAGSDYLVVAPFASRSAYELLILPRTHTPDFLEVDPAGFALILQDAFGRLGRLLDDPPSNLWIHGRPAGSTGPFHWHAHLVARLTVEGAWELGSGLAINIVPPEEAAARLRSC